VIVVKEMNVVGQKQQFFQRFLRTGYYGEHSIFWLKSCSIATLVGDADRYFLAAGNCHAQTALACSICNDYETVCGFLLIPGRGRYVG